MRCRAGYPNISIMGSVMTGLATTIDPRDVPVELMTSPLAPVSWGEFIDKLTILEIKSEKITDPNALHHVRTELARLRAAADPRWMANDDIKACKVRLRAVNETLWAIEDDIREKEARQEFDAAFIALARSVYRQNDERAEIKKAINRLLRSEIAEEKLYKSYR